VRSMPRRDGDDLADDLDMGLLRLLAAGRLGAWVSNTPGGFPWWLPVSRDHELCLVMLMVRACSMLIR